MKPKSKLTIASLAALGHGDLTNFMIATTPGGIEAQEKAGQIEQSFLETLPIKGTIKDRYSTANKATWKVLGFVFGENADDLFVNVQFPKGWRKKPSDHSMWSYLLDDKGRERAAIFYKAAFYDRKAHVHLTQRFSISSYEEVAGDKDSLRVIIKDCGKERESFGQYKHGDYSACDKLEAKAKEWLQAHYPDWNNPCAYWD